MGRELRQRSALVTYAEPKDEVIESSGDEDAYPKRRTRDGESTRNKARVNEKDSEESEEEEEDEEEAGEGGSEEEAEESSESKDSMEEDDPIASQSDAADDDGSNGGGKTKAQPNARAAAGTRSRAKPVAREEDKKPTALKDTAFYKQFAMVKKSDGAPRTAKPQSKVEPKSKAKARAPPKAMAEERSGGSRRSNRAAAAMATVKSMVQQQDEEEDDDFEDDDERPRRKQRAMVQEESQSDDSDETEATSPPVKSSRVRATRQSALAKKENEQAATNKRLPLRSGAAPPAKKSKNVTTIYESGSESGSESESEEDSEESEEEEGGSGEEEQEEEEEKPGKTRLLGTVERVLSLDTSGEKYLVKYAGKSYRQVHLLSPRHIKRQRPHLLQGFITRQISITVDNDWTIVERVIGHEGQEVGKRRFFTKWRGLEYSESTWEEEADLIAQGDEGHIATYLARIKAASIKRKPRNLAELRKHDSFEMPTFGHGRKLRDYQEVAVRWMVNNFCQSKNCILGDEMGLGKTAQSISVLECLRQLGHVAGPFLLVAPLTTLGHWQREIQTWTDMNVVVYSGNAVDRQAIVAHEFYHKRPSSGRAMSRDDVKFDAVLVSYDMLLKEKTLFAKIPFAAAIFDEAHKLKGINSATRAAVLELNLDWMLLLTGTPIQNNLSELFSVLNVLDPEAHPDIETFEETYGTGSGSSMEQVKALQAVLAPVLLRRMKEDVETLPEKEEVIVWVELTPEQRQYYKAMYGNQIGALMKGTDAKNLPNMRNLAMELRKLCCHPFLCNGLEEDITLRRIAAASASGGQCLSDKEMLEKSCGKMLLLSKLLPKLRAEGHKVLIFSQFKIMLDVLEDYLRDQCGYPVERIDGSVAQRDRQQSIDRFSKGEEDSFVFLLSTRAGGQGITLTAADTCIIYDSDWNPQNDLQAMARCHRIGQSKEVTVYRLITKDTYEEILFQTASRKYGLDEAILGNSECVDPEQDSKRIAQLLRHGAHAILAAPEQQQQKSDEFQKEDIDQILVGRTEKRQIGGKAGNSFSVATFALGKERTDGAELEGKDYWASLLPDAARNYEEEAARLAAGPIMDGPRNRRKVNYCLQTSNAPKQKHPNANDSDGRYTDSEEGEDDEDNEEGGVAVDGVVKQVGPSRRALKKEAPKMKKWLKADVKLLEEKLVALRPGNWSELYQQMEMPSRTEAEVTAVAQCYLALIEDACKADNTKVDSTKADSASASEVGKALTDSERASEEFHKSMAAFQSEETKKKRKAEHENLQVERVKKLAEKICPVPALPGMVAEHTLRRIVRQSPALSKALSDLAMLHTQMEEEGFKCRDISRKLTNGLPQWWIREHDEALLQSALEHGVLNYKTVAEGCLYNPSLPVSSRVAFDTAVGDNNTILVTRTNHRFPRHLASPSEPLIVDKPLPDDEELNEMLSQADDRTGAGLTIQAVLDIQQSTSGEAGGSEGFHSEDMLLIKFKGYFLDQERCWLSHEVVKDCKKFKEELRKGKLRLQPIMAHTQALLRQKATLLQRANSSTSEVAPLSMRPSIDSLNSVSAGQAALTTRPSGGEQTTHDSVREPKDVEGGGGASGAEEGAGGSGGVDGGASKESAVNPVADAADVVMKESVPEHVADAAVGGEGGNHFALFSAAGGVSAAVKESIKAPQLFAPEQWNKLIDAMVNRLKLVVQATADPSYQLPSRIRPPRAPAPRRVISASHTGVVTFGGVKAISKESQELPVAGHKRAHDTSGREPAGIERVGICSDTSKPAASDDFKVSSPKKAKLLEKASLLANAPVCIEFTADVVAKRQVLPQATASQVVKKPTSHVDKKPSSQGDKKPSSQGDKKPSSQGDKKPSSQGDKKPSSQGDKKPASQVDKTPPAPKAPSILRPTLVLVPTPNTAALKKANALKQSKLAFKPIGPKKEEKTVLAGADVTAADAAASSKPAQVTAAGVGGKGAPAAAPIK